MFVIKDLHAFHSVCRSSMHLGNRMEIVARAYRAGVLSEVAYKMVNYCAFKSVPSRVHAFDNIIGNVRPPLYSEVVTHPAAGRSRKWMRREQKAVSLLSDLVQRYSQPNDIVVDPFAGTCAVAKACMSLPLGRYRRVVVGDKDEAVLRATWAPIVDAFVYQVVQGGYRGAVASDDVVQAARLLRESGQRDGSCSAADAGTSARSGTQIMTAPTGPSAVRASSAGASGIDKENAWLAPKGVQAHSALPDSMLLFLASRWARLTDEERRGRWGHPQVPHSGRSMASMLLEQRGEPVDQWPPQLRCQLSMEDAMALRDQDAASSGVYVASFAAALLVSASLMLAPSSAATSSRPSTGRSCTRTWVSRRPRRRGTPWRTWGVTRRRQGLSKPRAGGASSFVYHAAQSQRGRHSRHPT